VDVLQAGVEPSFAVRPQAPVLLQPGKAAFDHPALGITANLCSLLRLAIWTVTVSPSVAWNTLGKRLAHVAAVGQHALYFVQPRFAALHRLQRPFAIRHLGRRHRNGVGQPLRIHANMALDARNLFARVITFATGRIRVLHALRVHDQERRFGAGPLFLAGQDRLSVEPTRIFYGAAKAGWAGARWQVNESKLHTSFGVHAGGRGLADFRCRDVRGQYQHRFDIHLRSWLRATGSGVAEAQASPASGHLRCRRFF